MQAATLDTNTAVELHQILKPNATRAALAEEPAVPEVPSPPLPRPAARRPKRIHAAHHVTDTTASLHLDLVRGGVSTINVTTFAAKEQLGNVAFTELWQGTQGVLCRRAALWRDVGLLLWSPASPPGPHVTVVGLLFFFLFSIPAALP